MGLLEPTLIMSNFPRSSIAGKPAGDLLLDDSQHSRASSRRVRFASSREKPDEVFIIQSRSCQEMPIHLEELHNRIHKIKQQLRKEKIRLRKYRYIEEDLKESVESLSEEVARDFGLQEMVAQHQEKLALEGIVWMLKKEIHSYRVETIRNKGLCVAIVKRQVSTIECWAKMFWIKATSSVAFKRSDQSTAAAICA